MEALRLENISKSFGDIQANNKVNMTVYKGEILSILGENGSGKTTLMNMIAGIYHPDEGSIYINENKAIINSPKDAFDYKVGMVHQHFKLVDIFTATQNIVLGLNEKEKFNLKKSANKIKEISSLYGFDIDPNKKIYEMSVSEKQTVEIIKVLYKGADILILDEPTAVLTPQEANKLFNILRKMKEDNKTIIIITHKLNEVLELSDRVVVLRKGEVAGELITKDTNEIQLTELMVGKKIDLNIVREDVINPRLRLSLNNVTVKNRDGHNVLTNVCFDVNTNEIFGIAGIAGSGQRELLEAISGLQHLDSGEIIYHHLNSDKKENLKDKTPLEIRQLGVRLSFVPEDRLGMGLVGNMDISDNMMLRLYQKNKNIFLDNKEPRSLAEKIVDELGVVTPSISTRVASLSGGNVQKVLVGREISSSPTVLMVAYPVRGLDINSSHIIYNLLNEQKRNGAAIIFVGEDLDVLLELSDRIMVINSGRVSGIVDARKSNKEELAYLMTKHMEDVDNG